MVFVENAIDAKYLLVNIAESFKLLTMSDTILRLMPIDRVILVDIAGPAGVLLDTRGLLLLFRRYLKRIVDALFPSLATLHGGQVYTSTLGEAKKGEIHWELFHE